MTDARSSETHGPLFDHVQFSNHVDRLISAILSDERIHHLSDAPLPDRSIIVSLLDEITALMYPGFFGPRDLTRDNLREHVADVLTKIETPLFEQVSGALRYAREGHASGAAAHPDAEVDRRARSTVRSFIDRLDRIQHALSLDVQAAFDGDPAARHTDEVIFCYPGFYAITVHRVAHELYRLGVPLIPRIMSEYAHAHTGIDIHPGARIGRSFFIDHGTGVVIGETTVIGDHCRVYQGVTLGAKQFERDAEGRLKRGTKRHPTLEDHVTVYAGATILGGDTVIGAGCVINGGVFLTHSVPAGHIVRAPKAEIMLRSNPDLPPGQYVI